MDGQVVHGQQVQGLKKKLSVWEPGELLASMKVSASEAEVASFEARVVAESSTVGQNLGPV